MPTNHFLSNWVVFVHGVVEGGGEGAEECQFIMFGLLCVFWCLLQLFTGHYSITACLLCISSLYVSFAVLPNVCCAFCHCMCRLLYCLMFVVHYIMFVVCFAGMSDTAAT